MEGDGDGWVRCARDHRHWGRFGAAGLLLHAVDDDGVVRLLLQHRAAWSHHGDTWGLPGGARHSHEEAVHAAIREAVEETGIDGGSVRTRHAFVDDHGGWSYTTVSADLPAPVATSLNRESEALAWVALGEVDALPLHPGFAHTWRLVRPQPVVLLVDMANVVGSRPDGWWRDRPGAAARLLEELAGLRGVTVQGVAQQPGAQVIAGVVAVLEGAAAAATEPGWVQVRRAARGGSGDDWLVQAAAALVGEGQRVTAVTADRELRGRLTRAGGDQLQVTGPSWLRQVLGSDGSGQRG
ncbi:MAG TPA: NUDIX hydrolase [Candidatus Nanopelagicales bacterium]